ncbi:MAG: PepSY domain-containing protein, partial [Pseudomonadota bacterium]
MTDATHVAAAPVRTTSGAFYRLVWKWHFLASLYVLPFMAMLAITGGLYLYKPPFENWYYADYKTVAVGADTVPLEDQAAALDAKRIRGITVFDDPTAATKIEFDAADGTRSYGWVDPYTGDVTGTVARDTMPMRLLQKFHGELLLGDFGTKFVELSAHWAIVMFITGVFLWWPRG